MCLSSGHELEQEWRALETEADISFFVSWSWIGPWLQMILDKGTPCYLYRYVRDGQTIALGIFALTTLKRRKFFRVKTLALHEIPQRNLDMIIEHNDLLIRRGYETETRVRLLNDLNHAPVQWDEVRLPSIAEAAWNQTVESNAGLKPIVEKKQNPWSTDISAIGGDLDKLLAPLSRNRRWQIRRSFKAFQEDGDLQLMTPANCEEALTYFDELGIFHTKRWNSVGVAGSFANPIWVNFHKGVIKEGFDRGEIQLLKVSAGNNAIGYVYSFIWRGTAYMLQTGFAQEDDNVRRSGFVSHCLAMQYNSTHGVDVYDYMCGDAEYKKVLGEMQPALVWGTFGKKRWQAIVESALVYAIRRLNQLKDLNQQSLPIRAETGN